jgi:hypothetical protein
MKSAISYRMANKRDISNNKGQGEVDPVPAE